MNCEQMKKLFEVCEKKVFIHNNTHYINVTNDFLHEARMYNCLTLSNELNQQCKTDLLAKK
jgi:hypothetical protein